MNKRIESLQPYVLSIRFNKGLTVIDTSFKEGWTVPKSNEIGFSTIPEKPNYYMLHPLVDNVGIDEMLDYVEYVIKVNVERETKYNLLVLKIKELEEIFMRSSLAKCETLQFKFDDAKTNITDGLSLSDMPLNVESSNELVEVKQPQRKVKPVQPPRPPQKKKQEPLPTIKIQDGEPPLSQVVEREVSADVDAWNKQAQSENPTARVGNEIIDLPPRNEKIQLETFDVPEVICTCDPRDPNQVCPECYDQKM